MKRTLLTASFTLILFGMVPHRVCAQSVDPLTGRLQMSIPLGSLNANDISIPISIYQKGTNMKVAEGESDLGVGWSLSAGGEVSRVVRGLPDEINTATKKGWLFNSNAQNVQSFAPIADDNFAICTDEATDWNSLETLIGPGYMNDTEPDIFFVSAPGLSARFIFGADGQPKLLTYQDLSIVVDFIGNVITIKTNSGLSYTFGMGTTIDRRVSTKKKATSKVGPHSEYLYYDKNPAITTFASSWNLTSVSSVRTGTTANFGYSAYQISGASRQYNSSDSLFFITDTYSQAKLNSITLKSSKVILDWSNNRLDGISIEETNSQEKQVVSFQYHSVNSSAQSTSESRSKSFLKNISVVGGCGLPVERTYEFDYEGFTYNNNLPIGNFNWGKNWQQDYFGYPNQDVNNKNLPTLYFVPTENDSRRLRAQPIIGTTYQTIAGQDRSVMATNAFGALKRIKLPTGGYTEIEYANNRYWDGSVAVERDGPGVRVTKITSQGGEAAFGKDLTATSSYRAIVKEYEYNSAFGSTTSGQITSPVTLGYITSDSVRQSVNNMGDEPMVMYARVKEKIQGRGYTVYEFSLSGMFPETAIGEWKATRSRLARKPGPSCLPIGNLKNGFYLYPYAPSTNYDFRRALASKVSVFTEANALVREQINTYTTLSKNPSIVKGLRFEKVKDIYLYGIYEMLTGRVDVISQVVANEASQEDPTKILQTTTNYAYNSNNFLQSVTTSLPNGTTTLKTMKYANDFLVPINATDTAAVALKILNDTNRGSELVEETNYLTLPGQAQTLTGSSLIIYRNFENINRVLPYYVRTMPTAMPFSPAFMNGQTFTSDSDYITQSTVREYDEEGRAMTTVDNKRNYTAIHYFKDLSVPAATFVNAMARQAVFEGFEMPTSRGLTPVGTAFSYVNGWTGKKAISLQDNGTNVKLASSAIPTELIARNGNRYRISCWVYGFQNAGVTFTAKGNVNVSSTLTNPASNKWNYLEGELNVATITGPFQLEVSANASAAQNIWLDDVLCMPVNARVGLQTMQPLKGVSSATDDRGNSTKSTYDFMGRPVDKLDRNRNVVLRNEYALKERQNNRPSAAFESDVTVYLVNSPVVFTAGEYSALSCQTGITYSWEVDGVGQANGPNNSFTYTFATPGNHNVTLTTTNSSGLSSAPITKSFCVEFIYSGSVAISVTDINGNPVSNTMDCNSAQRILSVQAGVLPTGCEFKVVWYRNGVQWSQNSQVVVDGIAVSSTTYVEYQAMVYQDCTNFNNCSTTQPLLRLSGTVSQTIVHIPSNCN